MPSNSTPIKTDLCRKSVHLIELVAFIFILFLSNLISIYTNTLSAQDSSYLDLKKLDKSDLVVDLLNNGKTKIIAGTRSEQNLEDIPFTVFVITADEIRDRGYNTLADALKQLPGIRVSQPGSAQDGETFLMRGLLGNTYAKILVNDIPLRPSVAGSMPIGSQLPIQQAERIEVIYGPSATLYGPDAAAGIINIILKESEYPTFAQANIELGEGNLTRMSAMFGGKLSVGKKSLKLKMYGGFTSIFDQKIKYDIDNLYNPQVYEDILLLNNQDIFEYEDRPNYSGTTGNTVLSNLPHQSNYIGFTASLGAFSFHSLRMFRSDHSSIGLNPLAASYANPQSLYGEEILSNSINFRKEYDRWQFNIRVNSLTYNINPLASYNYVLPLFGVISNSYAAGLFGPVNISPDFNAPASIDSLYLSGSRYVTSNFNDVGLEFQANFEINDQLDLAAGVNLEGGVGEPIRRFEPVPKGTIAGFSIPAIFQNPDANYSSLSSFLEAYYNLGNFSMIAGAQIFVRRDQLETNDPVFNPRIGLLYKVSPSISLRTSYSKAFRYPSNYWNGSSYQISAEENELNIEAGSSELNPEQTNSFEIGLRYRLSDKVYMDLSSFYTKTNNFINFDINQRPNNESLFWGFENDPDSFNRLIGTQMSLNLNDIIWPAIDFDLDVQLSYAKGKERILQFNINDIGVSSLIDLPVIRANPEFMGNVVMSFKPYRKLQLFFNHSFMSSSWTRNKLRIARALQSGDIESIKNKGYYTLSFRSIYRISRQMKIYFELINLNNAEFAGIDSSVDPNSLLYNPQQKRFFKFGVNFSFN